MLYDKAKEIHMERFPYNDFLFQKYDDLAEEFSEVKEAEEAVDKEAE